ncbi:Isocitrate/isopropylmalate dehydrogenase [Atractiella rhizophila]|nr:Isocitrate/isopropylmalate dehydrogenase [Atractiella rhizophila]
MIPGDGIGHVVIPSAQRVIEALSLTPKPSFVPLVCGFEHFQKTGISLPDETKQFLKSGEVNCAMFGAVSSPIVKTQGYESPIVRLRKELDLFANVRPVRGGDRNVDMTIVRENTECLYVRREHMTEDPHLGSVAIAERQISTFATKRIGQMAFEILYADSKSNGKKPQRVTIVHKSNVLRVTDGLFRETVRAVYEEGGWKEKGIEIDEQIVDSLVYRLFREPETLGVLVCPNLYGDIVSDGAAALVGSLGLVPSVNVGENFIMGEPVHGSAPDIASKTPAIANPIASIRSAALMLNYLGLSEPSARITKAVDEVLGIGGREGWLTPDLGGKGTTQKVEEEVIKRL